VKSDRLFSFYGRDGIVYVRFRTDKTGLWSSGKSTGFSDRRDAEFAVRAYLEGLRPDFRKALPAGAGSTTAEEMLGIQRLFELLRTMPLTPEHRDKVLAILNERAPTAGPAAEPVVDFLVSFWSFDESKYVKRRVTTGKRMSRRHCYDQARHVQNHWRKYFGERMIGTVTLGDLEDFSAYLDDLGLSGKTINNVMNAGVVALHWAYDRGIIATDPTQGFVKYAAKSVSRGVLTPDEVNLLFKLDWPDERAKLGNLLACTCGLRSGEIRSMKVGDLEVEGSKAFIARSWNRLDLFSDPKWGSFRDASIPEALRLGLLREAKASSFPYSKDLLIFHGNAPDRPRDSAYLLDALKEMLLRLNPDTEYWKGRRIDFHSWRHYFTSRLADILDEPTLMKATGHKTKDAFDEYAHHMTPEQFEKVRTAQRQIFGDIAGRWDDDSQRPA